MPKVNCAVVGCANNTYHLNKWKNETCDKHNARKGECQCDRPFQLYCFPSILRNNEHRQRWINAMKRENINKTLWMPKDSDRVCSLHFLDGVPTNANPDPTLYLGYDATCKKPRRKLFREPLSSKRLKRSTSASNISSTEEPPSTEEVQQQAGDSYDSDNDNEQPMYSPLSEHSYTKTPLTKDCNKCADKSHLINALVRKVNSLSLQVKKLKREKLFSSKSSHFTWRIIKTDAKMNFYTGISSIKLFDVIFQLLQPYLTNLMYWKGPSKHRRSFSKVRKYFSTSTKKLSQRDEFLLVLMRLRLGLFNEDLADRFGISTTLCSRTFTTWIRVVSKVLGSALVAWLPIESVRENLPLLFVKAGYSKCRVILDCFEVFIERPKSLTNQACTWSDYKHHNTIKFLVGISPTGFITFLSDCYGGRASDKFITKDSGFYNLLERGDEVMADRGFQIQEELLLNFCKLIVPPGARVKSQMTSSECLKTKKVANLRIHVERAINRIKCFRILSGTLSLTMLQHVDDIVRSCAALCNLKPVLIRSKTSSK